MQNFGIGIWYMFLFSLFCFSACAILVGPITLAEKFNDGRFLYIYLLHVIAIVYGLGASITNTKYSTR